MTGWQRWWRPGAALALALAAGSPVSAAEEFGWVSPQYKATPPEARELTIVEHYRYAERQYQPPVTITDPVTRQEARYGTPEEAMISRISAMMRGDYDWWLEVWDPASREFVEQQNAAEGRTPAYWTSLWADRLRFMRFRLVRRIETGPYVMVTYTMVTPEGEPATVLELPTVFRRYGDRWFATQELARDPLAPASPWVSGEHVKEVVVQ